MQLDQNTLQHLKLEWAGVAKMRERMRTLVVVTFATGAITGPALASVLYNLPLLLAFDVLQQTLAKARDQNFFPCSRDQLGVLMECAKDCLPWNDWPGLRDGVRRRNQVAHDGQLFSAEQCLLDVANIENQLVSWAVIDATPWPPE